MRMLVNRKVKSTGLAFFVPMDPILKMREVKCYCCCVLHNLTIANTMFQYDLESTWTFRGYQSCTQIDYIILDQKLFKQLVFCCCPLPEFDVLWCSAHEINLGLLTSCFEYT